MKPNRRPQQQKGYDRNKNFKKKKFDKPKGPPPFDVLLRQFKKKVERAGTIQEVRDRQYYIKPSEKRQKKINARKRLNERRIRLEKEVWEARKRSSHW